jgi:hypothetical protein
MDRSSSKRHPDLMVQVKKNLCNPASAISAPALQKRFWCIFLSVCCGEGIMFAAYGIHA